MREAIPSPLPGLVLTCIRHRWFAPPATFHHASGVRLRHSRHAPSIGLDERSSINFRKVWSRLLMLIPVSFCRSSAPNFRRPSRTHHAEVPQGRRNVAGGANHRNGPANNGASPGRGGGNNETVSTVGGLRMEPVGPPSISLPD